MLAAECLSSLAVSALQVERRISHSQEAILEKKRALICPFIFASSYLLCETYKEEELVYSSEKQVEIKTFK